ncbi:hypothetical protein C5167_022492 [Papaver somniferum]|uniref:AMP-activated protein kinase glycogen-binding domain-containing protein n=1 Tax=Papaver somniferum TaxID=3469 RepID=A0A4Y7JLR4_PAPSO|nr:hypothetical protein C5167_022492 [Papaver somniferum]
MSPLIIRTNFSTSFFFSPHSLTRNRHSLSLNLVLMKPIGSLGFGNTLVLLNRGNGANSRSVLYKVKCKGLERNDDDANLEKEILEFMRNSKNPNVFPTKKDLIESGRNDLVEAIEKQRGWLSLGWDLDNQENEEVSIQDNEEDFSDGVLENDCRIFQQRFDRGEENDSLSGIDEVGTSGRAMQMEVENESGIEGILSRLDRERVLAYGIGTGHVKNNGRKQSISNGSGHDRESRSTPLNSSNGILDDSKGTDSRRGSFTDHDSMHTSLQSDMRAWGAQTRGLSEIEAEAAEGREHFPSDDVMVTRNIRTTDYGSKDLDEKQIRSHLQHLELELSSALSVLSSRTELADIVSLETAQLTHIVLHILCQGSRTLPEETHELSDAWEFQETEIMRARDKLRSTRAKLALLEGRMSLAIIEARKIVEVKQKKIDEARKALFHLRSACIVWPSSGSEVLLTGSFDGWSSKRKMEKSTSGIFSLSLKLYPGRYEFKFIVDGEWKTDPLRPIVNSNGHENNLLIIS